MTPNAVCTLYTDAFPATGELDKVVFELLKPT